jgi:putative AlgH/UPF0301 family transcriptional regulator
MNKGAYLTNQLLIAMPTLGDPNFAQTVALVCDHSPQGALGLILNKPLEMRMGEIFEQLDLEIQVAANPLRERQVLRGGPMQTDRGFVVHRAGGRWDSTLPVSDAIHVTTSRDILAAMARGEGPVDAVVALGRDPRQRLAQRTGRTGADLRPAVRGALARRRASDRRGTVPHQPHQRQCLKPRPAPRRAW